MNKNYYNDMKSDNEHPVVDGKSNILNPDEAIKAGTVFKTLYQPYKNYRITDFSNLTEKEKMMLEIYKYGLIVHDLSLYLDVYPRDEEAVSLRKKYMDLYEVAMKKYEEVYPPFSLGAAKMNKTPYPWSTSVFPWGDE